MGTSKSRAWLSWLYLAVLFVLCGVLAALQYRWIGAVSSAERDRLQQSLQASLFRVAADFNSELAAACRSLLAPEPDLGLSAVEATIESRWPQWKQTGRNAQVFRAIAVATPRNGSLALRSLDFGSGAFHDAQWPPEWQGLKLRLESFRGSFRGMPGPPPGSQDLIFDIPLMRRGPMGRGGEGFPGFAPDEASWMIVQLNRAYLRDVLLPEVLQRHLGAGRSLEYYVEVLTRSDPPEVVYRSDQEAPQKIAVRADASVALLDPQFDIFLRRPGPPGFRESGGRGGPGFGRGGGPGMLGLGRGGPGMGRGGAPNFGRWELRVQHRAGSLEAAVSRTRRRNLAVTGGILLLMVAAFAALVRFTRRSQKLADMQMNFVAGVSHELRTPLTVLHTAGYNLRGKLARDPGQVERYGALIQRESARLRDLVEQVLLFASGKSGSLVRTFEPVSVEAAIEAALESVRPGVDAACQIETKIEPGLPLIMGDPVSLKHAVQNLIGNAAKYGTGWVGVFASRRHGREGDAVEIRVADRGPGIPADELAHVFEPFFRGKRALQDQIHGTGLGLSVAKGIVEAHGGVIEAHSAAGKATEFVIRVPAAPKEYQDEFTNSSDRG